MYGNLAGSNSYSGIYSLTIGALHLASWLKKDLLLVFGLDVDSGSLSLELDLDSTLTPLKEVLIRSWLVLALILPWSWQWPWLQPCKQTAKKTNIYFNHIKCSVAFSVVEGSVECVIQYVGCTMPLYHTVCRQHMQWIESHLGFKVTTCLWDIKEKNYLILSDKYND